MAWDSTLFVKSWLNSNHSWLWIGQLGRNQWKHPVRINWLYRIYSRSMCILFLVNCVALILSVHVCVCVFMCSVVQLCLTLWQTLCHAPLSMKFSRQECWSGLPFPPPGDLPNPGQTRVSYVFCVGGQILYHVGIIYNKLMFIVKYKLMFILTDIFGESGSVIY